MNNAARMILAGLLLGIAGCASSPPARIDPPPSVDADDWEDPPDPPDQSFAELVVGLPALLESGTCTDALASLRATQRRASEISAPWVAWVDGALAYQFSDIFHDYWPEWVSYYEGFAVHRDRGEFHDKAVWHAYQCGHAAFDYLAPMADCYQTDAPCSSSPRLIVDDLLGVAFAEPLITVPRGCEGSDVGPYPVEAVQATAQQAARAVVTELHPQWLDWMARESALHRLESQLDRWCRNSEDPSAAAWDANAQALVAEAVVPLQADPAEYPTGTWTLSNGRVRVHPIGPMLRVLTFEASMGSPAHRTSTAAGALPLQRRGE